MSDWEITVTGWQLTGLKKNGNWVGMKVHDENVNKITFNRLENDDDVQVFEPSDGFWTAVLGIDQITSRMAEHFNHQPSVVEGFMPDYSDSSLPMNPMLPKYEEVICWWVYEELLEIRTEGTHTTLREDYSYVADLLCEAYEQSEDHDEPPYYLQEE